MSADAELARPLEAFVSFPSPYTQSLLVKALVATLPSLSISLAPFPEGQPPALQWADYDLIDFETAHAKPDTHLTSSYVFRKALIRKHFLHKVVQEYLAKCRHRGVRSVLENGGIPQGWVVELQFADELDELLMDDLYELNEALRENDELTREERRWFILKPGFADRGQGIRMFSTEEELRAIFDEFEPESEDEDDSDQELAGRAEGLQVASSDAGSEQEDDDTGIMTSQLRHFVIQEYMPRPVLFDLKERAGVPSAGPLAGHKFHLRAYVLLTSTYTVHLARTMLALFSGEAYQAPASSGDELDLRPHLTNTCLQSDAFGAPVPPAELVKTLWELLGLTALNERGEHVGTVDQAWLDQTFKTVGEVVAESVKAGVECGSFALQLVPNAFEIFGVDLLLSFPPGAGAALAAPVVTLLEFNASPDFHQSGDRLRPELARMFQGVVRISVAPFFRVPVTDAEAEAHEWEPGQERWAWTLVGRGATRGTRWD